jgi:hypothetical protein
MELLKNNYGKDGFAVFFRLMERLVKTQDHFITLNDESELIYLESICRVSIEQLHNIVKECVRIKFFDSIIFEKYNLLWNEEFYESIKGTYKQRKNKPLSKSVIIELCLVYKDGNLFNTSINTQSKEEERILEKSKESDSTDPIYPSLEMLKKYFF